MAETGGERCFGVEGASREGREGRVWPNKEGRRGEEKEGGQVRPVPGEKLQFGSRVLGVQERVGLAQQRRRRGRGRGSPSFGSFLPFALLQLHQSNNLHEHLRPSISQLTCPCSSSNPPRPPGTQTQTWRPRLVLLLPLTAACSNSSTLLRSSR